MSTGETSADQTVTVVITTYNDADFLHEALASVALQQKVPNEIFVVDDGSEVSPAPIVALFLEATLICKPNGGLASARNAGLKAASAKFITFLDADDKFRSNAITAGLDCFARSPDAAMVYGGHIRISADGSQLGDNIYHPASNDPYADLLSGNSIGMHGTVMYRRDILLAVGGFDEGLRFCEDYDVCLRLARKYPIASHPQIVAEYRWHGRNMSRNSASMLGAALAVHDRHREQTGARKQAWRRGRLAWKSWYEGGQQKEWDGEGNAALPRTWLVRMALRRAKNRLQNGWLHGLYARIRGTWPPPLGSVRFGQLGTIRPVSLDFGWDRGIPIDRYYIENFLQARATDIRGRVLEIADDAYSSRFGRSQITRQDILHLHAGNSKATLVGDLTQPGVLPEDAFDCIVLTQTLHLIYDMRAALNQLHAALRPGGVLLLTVPGISQIDRGEWQKSWYWSLTSQSLTRLLSEVFDTTEFVVESNGNVFAAVAFLHGLAQREVPPAKLSVNDAAYPVIVTARAQKMMRGTEGP
jgi:glycosyltransferase involved in cell wall biosynthesis